MYESAKRIIVLTCCFILLHVSCLENQPSSLVRESRDAKPDLPRWITDSHHEDFPVPTFLTHPSNVTVRKGGMARLMCRVKDGKRVKWLRNGTVLDSTESKNHASSFPDNDDPTTKTYILQLTDIELTDAGSYQCKASSENGKSRSGIAFITVAVAPFFTKTPVNITVKSKLSARLECQADGTPHPEISWQKDGGYDFPAAKERRMHVMEDGQSFFITELKVEDQGVYSCRATNEAGEVSVNATLTVMEMPSFLEPMRNKVSELGQKSVIKCHVAGSPKPTILWTKDNQSISRDDRYFFTADNQVLVIVNSKRSDSGVYSCQLDNLLGTTRQSMTLLVADPLDSTFFSKGYFTGFTIFIIFISFFVLSLLLYAIGMYFLPRPQKPTRKRKRSSELSPSVSTLSFQPSQNQLYSPNITFQPDGTTVLPGMTFIYETDEVTSDVTVVPESLSAPDVTELFETYPLPDLAYHLTDDGGGGLTTISEDEDEHIIPFYSKGQRTEYLS